MNINEMPKVGQTVMITAEVWQYGKLIRTATAKSEYLGWNESIDAPLFDAGLFTDAGYYHVIAWEEIK